MRYFDEKKDWLKEQLARLLATLILLSMGYGAWLVWRWLAAWFS